MLNLTALPTWYREDPDLPGHLIYVNHNAAGEERIYYPVGHEQHTSEGPQFSSAGRPLFTTEATSAASTVTIKTEKPKETMEFRNSLQRFNAI